MGVITLWSLRISWRVMYNEGVHPVVLEDLMEGDKQWGVLILWSLRAS